MSKRRRNRAGRRIVRRQDTPQKKSPEWWARQGAGQRPPQAIGGTWYGQHQPTPEEIEWIRKQKAANRVREQEAERDRTEREERLAAAIKADTERIKAEHEQRIKAAQFKAARIEAETARIKAETAQIKTEKRYQPDDPGRRHRQNPPPQKKRRNRRKSSFKVAGSHIILPTKEDLRNIALDSSIAVVGFDKPVKIHSLLTNESYHQSKLLTQADFFCNRIVETHWPTKEFSMMDWWTAPAARAPLYQHTRRNT